MIQARPRGTSHILVTPVGAGTGVCRKPGLRTSPELELPRERCCLSAGVVTCPAGLGSAGGLFSTRASMPENEAKTEVEQRAGDRLMTSLKVDSSAFASAVP